AILLRREGDGRWRHDPLAPLGRILASDHAYDVVGRRRKGAKGGDGGIGRAGEDETHSVETTSHWMTGTIARQRNGSGSSNRTLSLGSGARSFDPGERRRRRFAAARMTSERSADATSAPAP